MSRYSKDLKSMKNKEDKLFAFKIVLLFIFLLVIMFNFLIVGIRGVSGPFITDTYYAIGVLEYLSILIKQNNSAVYFSMPQSREYNIMTFLELINANKEKSEDDIENEIIDCASRRYMDDYSDQLEQREGGRRDSVEWKEGAIDKLRSQLKRRNGKYFKNIEIFIKKDGKIGSGDVFLIGLSGGRMNMKRLEDSFMGYIGGIDKINHYYSNNYYHFRNKYWLPYIGGKVLSKKVIIY
jgi:hypothetical protein